MTSTGVCQAGFHLLPAQCRKLPVGKLATYQSTGRQCFCLCSKRQTTAHGRYKRLVYQCISSMQYHVAITVFHLHHPASQLIAAAGSMARTARKEHCQKTPPGPPEGGGEHPQKQLLQPPVCRAIPHPLQGAQGGAATLPLPHRAEVRIHHRNSWCHSFPSAQNHVHRWRKQRQPCAKKHRKDNCAHL